jgi:hypothetical protein
VLSSFLLTTTMFSIDCLPFSLVAFVPLLRPQLLYFSSHHRPNLVRLCGASVLVEHSSRELRISHEYLHFCDGAVLLLDLVSL